MKSFTSMSVLTELTIKIPGMSGKDESATNVANAELKATSDAGYYKKCKIARADILPAITARDHARDYRRMMTSPWGDNDLRLLPTARLLEYNAAMGDYKVNFEKAVSDIESNWDTIVDKQRTRLNKIGGTLFDPKDYPPRHKISEKFVFKTGQLPVPEVSHFVLDLEHQALEELKEDLDRTNTEKMNRCQLDMFERLIAPVSKMADICSNDKRIFASLFENLEQTLDILTDLNVTGNIDFMDMIADVKNHLTGFTPGQVRKNKHLKQQLGQKADELSAKMKAMVEVTNVKDRLGNAAR